MTIPAIPQLDPAQAGKEQLLNELFGALRAFFTLGFSKTMSTGLTIWFYGGRFLGTDLANQSLSLPASAAAIYIEASATTGTISMNTAGYTSGKIALGIAVTSAVGLASFTPEQGMSGGSGSSGGGIPITSKSADYTTVLGDANTAIYHPPSDTTARTWTIPSNAAVAYPNGTALTFDNDFGAGAVTIAITADTLVFVGTAGGTGSRTLAAGGQATALKVSATRWRINGTGLS